MKKRTDTKVELEDKQTQTDTHTHKWTNRQENISYMQGHRLTDKCTHIHTNWQTCKQTDKYTDTQMEQIIHAHKRKWKQNGQNIFTHIIIGTHIHGQTDEDCVPGK